MAKKKRQKIGPELWDLLQWHINRESGAFELEGDEVHVKLCCGTNGPAYEIADWLREVADELEAVANEI